MRGRRKRARSEGAETLAIGIALTAVGLHAARLPGTDHFLINPYGMFFDEITASSLIKVDAAGTKLEESPHPVNPAGFVIHSAIHAVRHDVVCVLHTHTPAGVAVSAQRNGLLPISQQATIALGSLGYHDYEGIALRDDEKPRLQKDLGTNTNLILRNHGLLTGRRDDRRCLPLHVQPPARVRDPSPRAVRRT